MQIAVVSLFPEMVRTVAEHGVVGRAMERQLETCVQYARVRRQFDQPIGKFQSVANRIADMKVRLETARLLLYKVAWLKQAGKSATMEAAMANDEPATGTQVSAERPGSGSLITTLLRLVSPVLVATKL